MMPSLFSLPAKALIGWLGCGLLGLAMASGCQRNVDDTVVASPVANRLPAPSAPTDSTSSDVARFVDVAPASGLDYRWSIEGKRPLTILQTIGNGCAFLDYNNDDNLDILLVGERVALYRGDGRGHFQNVSRASQLESLSGHFLGCTVGDYDNDGYDDLYLSGYNTGLLLRNFKGRAFQDETRQAGLKPQPWGTSGAFADIDGSGRLSLYVGNYVAFSSRTQPQLCSNSGHLTACSPRSYAAQHGVLYRNIGKGRFEDATKNWGAQETSGKTLGACFADFDNSGRQSLALANDEVAGNLLHNTGKRFRDIAVAAGTAYASDGSAHAGMGQDWGDYDNDGRPDLAVTTYEGEVKNIYRNNGGSIFEDRAASLGIGPTPYVSFGEKWLDFDNDGWLDLAIANGHTQDNIAAIDPSATYRQPTQLFRNNKGTNFADLSAQSGAALQKPIVGRGLATGDYDNDGRMDLLVVDSEGAPLLLHNQSPKIGHWLQLRLQGTRSNRSGFGARVTATMDGPMAGRRLVRWCHSDGSYLSASDKRVHLGLGAATMVETLHIRWPSGHVDKLKNVAANRVLTVREGSTSAR